MTAIFPRTCQPHDTQHCVHCGAKYKRTKHRVTYIHPISNPRDTADQIPAVVELLDVDALMAAYYGTQAPVRRAVAKFLRKAGILPSGVRARDVRLEAGHMVIITAITGLHAVRVDLTPCYDALTSDKAYALAWAARSQPAGGAS